MQIYIYIYIYIYVLTFYPKNKNQKFYRHYSNADISDYTSRQLTNANKKNTFLSYLVRKSHFICI